MTDTTPRRELLLEILSFARPHDSPTERAFSREFLDKVPGMRCDPFGNRYLRIGTAPILWSSHVDTVAKRCGPQAVTFDDETGLAYLSNPKNKMSLGADDGVGVWMMLHMIEAEMEGLYIFHRGEEVGGLGSNYILRTTPQLLEGIQMAVAFDRAGYSDVITHQMGKTASDGFAWSFADQLNSANPSFHYRPDDSGVFTDTQVYSDVIPECSNISVGYFNQHSKDEVTDVFHAEALLDAVLKMDLSKLKVEREPGDSGYSGFGTAAWGDDAWWNYPTMAELEEAVIYHPEATAELLMVKGLTVQDILGYVRTNDAPSSERVDDDVPFDHEREVA